MQLFLLFCAKVYIFSEIIASSTAFLNKKISYCWLSM